MSCPFHFSGQDIRFLENYNSVTARRKIYDILFRESGNQRKFIGHLFAGQVW